MTDGSLLQAYRAPPQLDDAARYENSPAGVHGEPEFAAPAHRFALGDGPLLRKQCTRRDQPAAQIRARRACSWILDDRAVLGKEKARQDRTRFVLRPDVGHRARDACAELHAA